MSDDLAARLRAEADKRFPGEPFGPGLVADLRAAADIVERHQRLLDAIGDPAEILHECPPHVPLWAHRRLRRIVAAVDGAS